MATRSDRKTVCIFATHPLVLLDNGSNVRERSLAEDADEDRLVGAEPLRLAGRVECLGISLDIIAVHRGVERVAVALKDGV